MIYDENTQIFGLHASYQKWYLMQGVDLDEERLVYSELENEYQDLFRRFCESVAIEARVNPALQRSMLPMRFRPNMTEFQ